MGCEIDPADFPENRDEQFPWRMNEPPTILPVIRMGPGTMVVVVPSSQTDMMGNQGIMQVAVQPVPQM